MRNRWITVAAAVGFLLIDTGCRHCCRLSRNWSDDVPPPPPRGGGAFLDDPVPPQGLDQRFPPPTRGGDTIPPANVPSQPPPAGSGDSFPPPEIPENRDSLRIDPLFPTQPGERPTPERPLEDSELLLPDPLPPGAERNDSATDILTEPPGLKDNGYLGEPIRPKDDGSAPPSISDEPGERQPTDSADLPEERISERAAPPGTPPAVPRLENDLPKKMPEKVDPKKPAGVPGFIAVPDLAGVYTGRRPTVEGFDQLKKSGIRTIVYLHGDGENVDPARELAEERGLGFEPILVTKANISKAIDRFNDLISDRSGRPIYVSDQDGSRAGALWYAYFRTVGLLGEEPARVRAGPLGLSDSGEAGRVLSAAARDAIDRP